MIFKSDKGNTIKENPGNREMAYNQITQMQLCYYNCRAKEILSNPYRLAISKDRAICILQNT